MGRILYTQNPITITDCTDWYNSLSWASSSASEINKESEIHKNNFGGMLSDGTYIKKVLYNNPATICFWSDNTKTVCKCSEKDSYSPETGLQICFIKKLVGGKAYNELISDWVPAQTFFGSKTVTLSDVRRNKKHK